MSMLRSTLLAFLFSSGLAEARVPRWAELRAATRTDGSSWQPRDTAQPRPEPAMFTSIAKVDSTAIKFIVAMAVLVGALVVAFADIGTGVRREVMIAVHYAAPQSASQVQTVSIDESR